MSSNRNRRNSGNRHAVNAVYPGLDPREGAAFYDTVGPDPAGVGECPRCRRALVQGPRGEIYCRVCSSQGGRN